MRLLDILWLGLLGMIHFNTSSIGRLSNLPINTESNPSISCLASMLSFPLHQLLGMPLCNDQHLHLPRSYPSLFHSHWNLTHLTKKCSTCTYPLPHKTHLSSSAIPHIFLSSNSPADSVHIWLPLALPMHQINHLPALNPPLMFYTISSCFFLQYSPTSLVLSPALSILNFHSHLAVLSWFSANPHLHCCASYSSYHPTPPGFFSFSVTIFTNLHSLRWPTFFHIE